LQGDHFIVVFRVEKEENIANEAEITRDTWNFSPGVGCVIRSIDDNYNGNVYLVQIVEVDKAVTEDPRRHAALLVMRTYLNQYDVIIYKLNIHTCTVY
jgi:hypothetical protein